MSGLAGKKNRVKVGTTSGGAFNVMLGIKSTTVEIDGTNVDDSEFGVDWAQRLQGIKDFKVTLSGPLRPTDATGQQVAIAALLNDTELWIQVLPDNGTTASIGFKGQVLVGKFSLTSAVDGTQDISFDLEGTGAVTQV